MENLSNFAESLAATTLARAVQESNWIYPATEVVHLMGLALVIGPALMWDLRLLGLSKQIPISLLGRHLLPWTGIGLLLSLVSGCLLFLADPLSLAASDPFRIKLVLLLVAGLNAGFFHLRTSRDLHQWDRGSPAPPLAKCAACASILIWSGVVTAGRLIAYL